MKVIQVKRARYAISELTNPRHNVTLAGLMTTYLRLKKGEDRRIRAGHPWVYSNEIDTATTPLKTFSPGAEVIVIAHDKSVLGAAYVNPHSLIAARLYSRNPQDHLDADFFQRQLKAALALREQLFSKPYYRLVFSEADGLPGLVIDRFGPDIVIQVNTAGMEHKQTLILQALCSLITNINSVLLRNDSPIREHEGLELYVKPLLGQPPDEILLQENNVQFYAPFLQGQKTGWFYDHRLNRARLKHYVRDKSVLDVFSYLGGFGIQAAYFGAKQVDCIEASQLACDYIRKNAELNQVSHKVEIMQGDAFDVMKQQDKHYDVIILDPPAFVKKAKDKKQGLIAYQRLNELALKRLLPNGILVSCSCSMQVSMEELVHMMQRVAYRTQSQIQLLERGHQGPDHPIHIAIPETDYLKAVIIRKIGEG